MPPAARPGWALVIPWDTSSPGGVSQVVVNLARALKAHGRYQPVIVVQDWKAARPRTAVRNGITHVFARMRASPAPTDPPPRRWRDTLLGPVERLLLWRMFRTLRIAVLNVHYPALGVEAVAAAWQGGTLIFSLHGQDLAEMMRRGPEHQARTLRMLARGHALVAVSHAFAAKVPPEGAARLTVIHNGVFADALAGQPAWPDLPARYILNVATFEPKKGQRHLLDAFASIAASHPGLHLVLAGRTAASLPDLLEQRRLLGLERRIMFLQDVEHARVGGLFKQACLFCLSSLDEPFGIVLLEAGVFALPVVASRIGGVPEVIRDGQDGILVEPGNHRALAEAMQALLHDPERAANLGTSLRRRVAETFSWDRAAHQYMDLVQKRGTEPGCVSKKI